MRKEDEDSVRELIRETVSETLTLIGFNVQNPLQMQQDMAYLAKLRRGAEEVKATARSAAIKTCLGAICFTALYLVGQRLGIDVKLR